MKLVIVIIKIIIITIIIIIIIPSFINITTSVKLVWLKGLCVVDILIIVIIVINFIILNMRKKLFILARQKDRVFNKCNYNTICAHNTQLSAIYNE